MTKKSHPKERASLEGQRWQAAGMPLTPKTKHIQPRALNLPRREEGRKSVPAAARRNGGMRRTLEIADLYLQVLAVLLVAAHMYGVDLLPIVIEFVLVVAALVLKLVLFKGGK
ncbi:hypothetical protein [Deinococcus ruber]|nr:hypothetical protein [Deinococcus ruber]